MEGSGAITRILADVRQGNRAAYDQLFSLVYDELRPIARRQLRREQPGHTLRTTALVHEAYVKLAGGPVDELQDRARFFGIAARAMRQVLVDYARQRNAAKRGAGAHKTSLTGKPIGFKVAMEEVLALDTALDRLAEFDPRLRDVVECRYFGGLSATETAEVLRVGERTVERDWVKARAWLYKELYKEGH